MPAHPPIDPELQVALEALADDMATASLTPAEIPAIRASVLAKTPTLEQLRMEATLTFDEVETGGPSLLLCRQAGTHDAAPGVLFLHPGGTISGTNRTGISTPLDWVRELGVVVASVEYRLAPEHPHPAPVEDSYAALEFLAAQAATLGVDPARLVIAGISAGGGLAAATSLLARDRGGPPLAGQMLMCPMLDDRNTTPSSHELDGAGTWDRRSNLTAWDAYLAGGRGKPGVSPHAAPARATDLTGLPPAFLDVGSVETFRDEVVEFAARLWHAAGSAELHVWPGAFHGFDQVAPESALGVQARAAQTSWLRRTVATPPHRDQR